MSLRYRTNNYLVPTEYGHRDVLAKSYVHEVGHRLRQPGDCRHRRSYERKDLIFAVGMPTPGKQNR
jgi:hypothetical protein